MILVAGLPREPPIALVSGALEEIGAPFVMVDQRRHRDIGLTLVPALDGGEVGGCLKLPDRELDLAEVRGVYSRLHGEESLPDLTRLPAGTPARERHRRFVERFTAFADLCPGVVFNRSPGMGTNNSKGFQLQIVEGAGFRVPRTLITNDAAMARRFIESMWSAGRQVVYKSASAVRSIVHKVTRKDLDRLGHIRICPVQFQERVEGTDHRVHVVGETVFATRIETTVTDYRYAQRQEEGASRLSAAVLPPQVERRCIRLAQAIGIAFAGIDLRLTGEGEWFCFEVNPSPAFSYYENNTGQPIAEAVARALAGM
jgi:glutathione synthase/RimK-type ligase-like ATP-grasp enzyme